MIRFRISYLLSLLASLSIAGCGYESPDHLPMTKMKLGSDTVTLEIANAPASRTKGLMERDSMPEDHGMIFIFPEDTPQSFWMKNTRFPLDIVFINSQSKIVSIHTMRPYVTTSTYSAAPAKYAIELHAGKAKELGLQAGQSVSLPSDLPQAKDSY